VWNCHRAQSGAEKLTITMDKDEDSGVMIPVGLFCILGLLDKVWRSRTTSFPFSLRSCRRRSSSGDSSPSSRV